MFWNRKPSIRTLLETNQQTLERILAKMTTTDDAITKLQGDVAALTTVDQAAQTLLTGLSAQLAAAIAAAGNAGATPAQLQELTDLSTAIETNSAALSAAVTANTPPPAPAQ